MEDSKKMLMGAILQFLRGELSSSHLNSEDLEGLEVAIQCLESIYDVPAPSSSEPPLDEIYSTYLSASVINRPDASDEAKKEAERLKSDGNLAMTNQLYLEALDYYTRAIALDSKNAVYYCNRAAAYSKLMDHKSAIKDCQLAIQLDPSYSKAYGRLGLAYTGLENYEKALENYRLASELDPENEGYRSNVSLAQRKCAELQQARHDGSTSSGLPTGNGPNIDLNVVFGNPQLLTIATQMLSDPTMQSMMSSIMAGGLGPDGSGRMDALIQAGQQLAQQMQAEHPGLVDQLRATLGNGGDSQNQNPNSSADNPPNDSDKEG